MESKGFTIIELLIVIGTIGIIAVLVLVSIDPVEKNRVVNDARVQRDVNLLARAMETYVVSHEGLYPAPEGGDIQQELIDAGEIKAKLTPPSAYLCDGANNNYAISVGQTAKISCMLKSKKFAHLLNASWVWCSQSGLAGPTDGACP